MLVEFAFESIYGFLTRFMDTLGISFDFTFEMPALDAFMDILSAAVYFFPWRSVAPILLIIINLMAFRIWITFVRFVLRLLPFINVG